MRTVCNNGWLVHFKNRNNNAYGKIRGEASSVDISAVNDWLKRVWPYLRRDTTDNDIYNANKTDVFYYVTPEKNLKLKVKNMLVKLVQIWFVVLLYTSTTTSEKNRF